MQISVKGDNGKNLPSAYVLFTALPNGSSKAKQTDLNGMIAFKVTSDSIKSAQIKISHLGFKSITDTISLGQSKQYSYQMSIDTYGLGQVVVTAQYMPVSIDKSIHDIRVIDEDRLLQQAAINLRDVLQKETNMRVSQDNILGSGLSMQGISGQNVKILVDGIPVIGRLNGNVDISQINVNNVERIEIIEGPLSVNYGTDALAGTVNVITKKQEAEQWDATVNTYFESVGQYNIDGRLGAGIKNHSFVLSGGRNYFDGWTASDHFFEFPRQTLADSGRVKNWNPKEQYFMNVQYSFSHGSWNYRPYFDFFQEKIVNRGTPRAPYHVTAFDDHYRTWRKKGGLDVSGYITPDYKFNAVASYSRFKRIKNTYYRDLTTLDSELTTNSGDQDTSVFDLWMSRGSFSRVRPNAKISFELGYEINVENAEGRRIDGGERSIGDYAAFGSLEYSPIDGLTIKPGIRYGYNSAYQAPVTPSLNIRYSVKRFTIRGSYARGFRAPTLKELYFDFVDINHNIQGSQDLKAEHSDNGSLSVKWKYLKAQSSLKFGVSGFYNDIRNMISLGLAEGSNTEFTYLNIGAFRTTGVSLSTDLKFYHLTGIIGFSCVGRYNDLADSEDIPAFSFTPEIRTVLTYDFKKLKGSISLFYNYIGELPSYSSNSEGDISIRKVEDYHLLDLTASKRFWKDRIILSIGAKNLLNIQQVDSNIASVGAHSSGGAVNVGWGRSVFAMLKFRFGSTLKKKTSNEN